MHILATRKKTITIMKTVELLTAHRIPYRNIDADALFVTLKRKCFVCGHRFQGGDDLTVCMFVEDGNQQSGGAHLNCISGDRP